jgi:large subunit ribosomal protein L30
VSSSGKLKVRLVRSPIGYARRQKDTVRSLGFTRMNQTRELPDNPAVRGMIAAVCHLVKVVDAAGKVTS